MHHVPLSSSNSSSLDATVQPACRVTAFFLARFWIPWPRGFSSISLFFPLCPAWIQISAAEGIHVWGKFWRLWVTPCWSFGRVSLGRVDKERVLKIDFQREMVNLCDWKVEVLRKVIFNIFPSFAFETNEIP